MPLLDHFHPPLAERFPWEGFHTVWAATLAEDLNLRLLPREKYYAVPQIHYGTRIEVDIATFEDAAASIIARRERRRPGAESGGAALAVIEAEAAPLEPREAELELPGVFPDDLELRVITTRSGGPELVGAIELVSPVNKDRPEARRAFACKCAAYLQRGIGLIVVDIVSDRRANLHDELVRAAELEDQYRFPGSPSIYAIAYRPAIRGVKRCIDGWPRALAIGGSLPTLPLALWGGPTLAIDLESTYEETRRRTRLLDAGG